MKTRQFLYAAMVAVCTVAMTTLVGCIENNKPDEPQPQEDTTPVAAVIDVNVTFAEQTLEIFAVSFDYYDENGEKKNEAVTQTAWVKKIQSAGLPAKLGFHMNLAVKEGVDLTQYQQFHVEYNFGYESVLVNAAGVGIGKTHGTAGSSSQGMAISKIDAYLNSYANHPFEVLHSYAADGTWQYIDWE